MEFTAPNSVVDGATDDNSPLPYGGEGQGEGDRGG